MASNKILNLAIVCSLIVCGERLGVSSLSLQQQAELHLKKNFRIEKYIPSSQEYIPINGCGGFLTEAPGNIEQSFIISNIKNIVCTWKIHAPEDHLVYVRDVEIFTKSIPGRELHQAEESTDLKIYNSTTVDSNYQVFSLKKDEECNACISSNQDMTIILTYNETNLNQEHKFNIRYGFIKKSDIPAL